MFFVVVHWSCIIIGTLQFLRVHYVHCVLSNPYISTCRRTQLQQNQRHHTNRSPICRRHWLGSKQHTQHQRTGGKYHSKDTEIQSLHRQRKDRTKLYKKKWRRTLEKMQISRKPLEHNRRHQKKKTTGKCRIQQAQTCTRRQEDYSQNQVQNTRCVCWKHIPLQQRAVDCDTRPGIPD